MLRKKLRLGDAIEEQPNRNDKQLENIKILSDDNMTSKYFDKPDFWEQLYKIECDLGKSLSALKFPNPIAAVYNPVDYASEIHCNYLRKFARCPIPVLFIGMNPGPWGMCQTGVPFGYIPAVRDWMRLSGAVKKPSEELPNRPVTGLLCAKAEQSGQRFWGLFQEICGDQAETFFNQCFVYNFCPLAFFHSSGRNITPAEIKGDVKNQLQELCSQTTAAAIELFAPKIIVSIGRYTEDRVKLILKSKTTGLGNNITHLCMPHPSPRSLNNTNWNEKAKTWLKVNGIMPYLTSSNT